MKFAKELSVSVRDGIATVVFEQYVLKLDLLTKLALALYKLEEDPAVRVILLTGRRNLFLSGADLKEFDDLSNSRIAAKFIEIPRMLMQRIYACNKVTIAVINGYCIGGGLELTLACDFRVCVDKVLNLAGEAVPFIGLTEVGLGVVSPLGSSYYLPRLVGLAHAKELMMTARLIDGERALNMGLVHRLATEERLMEVAGELAAAVNQNGAFAVSACKKLLNASFDRASLAEALLAEQEAFAACCDTDEKERRISTKVRNSKKTS